MKFKIIIILSVLLMMFHLPVAANSEIDDEIKQVVEELIVAKSIEWEIVFGYPIEEARLLGDLTEGRNIDYVVDYFEKYYEEDILQQYLYYLKRSNQKFYHQTGVFWGDHYKEVGNIYKREATRIEYEVEYQSVRYIEDSIEVVTVITPIYYGDYLVRGIKSTEFREDPFEMIFHLKESNEGQWKLTQLSDDVLNAMQNEIGENIVLNQKEELVIDSKIKSLADIDNYNINDINFIYDAFKRLEAGGRDALYDQYNQVWVIDEFNVSEIEEVVNNFSLENLHLNYQGWDYAYVYKEIEKGKQGYALAFNISENDIIKMSAIPLSNVEEEERSKNEKIISAYKEVLNEEMNVFLGVAGGYENSWKVLDSHITLNYREKLNETLPFWEYGSYVTVPFSIGDLLMPSLVDRARRIDTARIPYWKVDEETSDFSLVQAPGKQTITPYDNFILLKIGDETTGGVYCCLEEQIQVYIAAQYTYESINLHYYGIEEIIFGENREKNKWWLSYSYKHNEMWQY